MAASKEQWQFCGGGGDTLFLTLTLVLLYFHYRVTFEARLTVS